MMSRTRLLDLRPDPTFLTAFAPIFIVLAGWLLLTGPIMTVDGYKTWAPVIANTAWNGTHTWPYAAFIWIVTRVAAEPALVALMQAAVVAAGFARLSVVLSRRMSQSWWPVAGAVVTAALAMGYWSVHLWKDVLYTGATAWLAAAIIAIVMAELHASKRTWLLVEFALACVATGLFRWNGFVVSIVATIVAVLVVRGGRKLLVLSIGCVAGLLSVGVLWIAPSVSPVAPVDPEQVYAMQLADMAYAEHYEPDQLGAVQKHAMIAVAPLSTWSRVGQGACGGVNETIFGDLVLSDGAAKLRVNAAALAASWSGLAKQHPMLPLTVRACRLVGMFSLAYITSNTLPPPKPGRIILAAPNSVTDDWVAFEAASLLRSPFPYLLVAFALAAASLPNRRWRAATAAISVPLGIIASYALIPYSTDSRYWMPANFICLTVLIGAVGALVHRRRQQRRTGPAERVLVLPADAPVRINVTGDPSR